jgi:hypothetical protein
MAHRARKAGIVRRHQVLFKKIRKTAAKRTGALHRAIAQAMPNLPYEDRSIKGLLSMLRSKRNVDPAILAELTTLHEVVRIRNITFVALHGNAPGFDQF